MVFPEREIEVWVFLMYSVYSGEKYICELSSLRSQLMGRINTTSTKAGAMQSYARSLAGQADCGTVTLEGGLPPSLTSGISESLRNSAM